MNRNQKAVRRLVRQARVEKKSEVEVIAQRITSGGSISKSTRTIPTRYVARHSRKAKVGAPCRAPSRKPQNAPSGPTTELVSKK